MRECMTFILFPFDKNGQFRTKRVYSNNNFSSMMMPNNYITADLFMSSTFCLFVCLLLRKVTSIKCSLLAIMRHH